MKQEQYIKKYPMLMTCQLYEDTNIANTRNRIDIWHNLKKNIILQQTQTSKDMNFCKKAKEI